MKRESLNDDEIALNDDDLLPLIDEMYESRKNALEILNIVFDTNISVELSSSWKIRRKEIEIELKTQESEITKNDEEVIVDEKVEDETTSNDN